MKEQQFAVDARKRLGKKLFESFLEDYGCAMNDVPLTSVEDVSAYCVSGYEWARGMTGNARFAGLSAEEIFLTSILRHRNVFVSLGLIRSWEEGDFGHLYRGTLTAVRYAYAPIALELKKGSNFDYGRGIDHGGYDSLVWSCFACMRPDLAKRFFPRERGLVRRSHPLVNRLCNLVIGLLHEDEEWKKEALETAKQSLGGEYRDKADKAAVQYLVALYESDARGMSKALAVLLKNYHNVSWLGQAGGDANALTVHAMYLMAKLYSDGDVFAQVQRPSGPGWWDEYVDLCLADPLPANLDDPFIIFPEPVAFINDALAAIDRPAPAPPAPKRRAARKKKA